MRSLFEKHKVCILLPCYNNVAGVEAVIRQCLAITPHVLVVNDGSTDGSGDVIRTFDVLQVHYTVNRGKGYALQTGFRKALESGYQYVISMDTDGQHYPQDCLQFLEKLEEEEGLLLVGARNLNQENVPGKSSFGNRFSNFWFRLETGISLPDTQSGFRLYPVYRYRNSRFFTRKYEFEIEILVRSAWKGIPVKSVPIGVFYPEREKRISHFRPGTDFFRISILNSVLVIIAFLYIKPRDLLLKPLREKGLKKGLKEMLFNPSETIQTRAASVGFGFFMGILPIWGFQLLVGIPLAVWMRMNKTLFIVAANISIFPPVIWAASLACGKIIYRNPNWNLHFHHLQWETVKQTGKEFFVGGTVLAILAGIIGYLLSYLILAIRRRIKS